MEIGAKIKSLRVRLGLTQEEVADRCELSKGFISQLENDVTSPSIATLIDILECLGSSPRAFFTEDDHTKTVFTKDDMFEKEDDAHGKITWLVPTAQKNTMEPILVTLGPGQASAQHDPHEGEEFGYILTGSVYLCTGNTRQKVRAGESFCIHPTQVHYLENTGKVVAKAVWVSTPPSF